METNIINNSNADFTNKTLDEINLFINEKNDALCIAISSFQEEKIESWVRECKMIFMDLKAAHEQKVEKYKDSISLDEYNNSVALVNIFKENENTWKDWVSVVKTFLAMFNPTYTKASDSNELIARIDAKIQELEQEDSF